MAVEPDISSDFSLPSNEDFERALDVLVFVCGVDEESNPRWALISIRHNRFTAFKSAERKGSYRVDDYGQILERGLGLKPSEEVLQTLHARYGAQWDYEDKLTIAMLEELNK